MRWFIELASLRLLTTPPIAQLTPFNVTYGGQKSLPYFSQLPFPVNIIFSIVHNIVVIVRHKTVFFFFSEGRSSRKRILIVAVNAVLMDLKLKPGNSHDDTGVKNILLMNIMMISDW